MKREEFISAFLGAFGETVVVTAIESDHVSGTVIYDAADAEERQDFCWHASDAKLPSDSAYRLACLIEEEALLDIDRITLPQNTLRQKYNGRWGVKLKSQEFEQVLRELESIKVRMVDDGEETDTFFMHE